MFVCLFVYLIVYLFTFQKGRVRNRVSTRSRSLNGSCSSDDSRRSPLDVETLEDPFNRVSTKNRI